MVGQNWKSSLLLICCPGPMIEKRGSNQLESLDRVHTMDRVLECWYLIKHAEFVFLDPVPYWTHLEAEINSPLLYSITTDN